MTNTPISITIMPLPYVLTDIVGCRVHVVLESLSSKISIIVGCSKLGTHWNRTGDGS